MPSVLLPMVVWWPLSRTEYIGVVVARRSTGTYYLNYYYSPTDITAHSLCDMHLHSEYDGLKIKCVIYT